MKPIDLLEPLLAAGVRTPTQLLRRIGRFERAYDRARAVPTKRKLLAYIAAMTRILAILK